MSQSGSRTSVPDETPCVDTWLTRYRQVREASEAICRPLACEDYVIQSMPDVSPPKWHLAHVSWFFEAFLLKPFLPGYTPIDPAFDYLFNSYYETHGAPFPRALRGTMSRPTVAEVHAFRAHVDQAMTALLSEPPADAREEIMHRVELGLHHEQQHQELLVMDIKHILGMNPLHPVYRSDAARPSADAAGPQGWVDFPEGVRQIGRDPETGFTFDCETPRHRVYQAAFSLARRPVTNAEYMAFMADGGYERTELWLSDGWAARRSHGWTAPLYWSRHDGVWHHMTLGGLKPVDPDAPVCHVSFFEADAFARWAGARLPVEAEWEIAAQEYPVAGHFQGQGQYQPVAAAASDEALVQMYGDVWEWTASAFRPYPGFAPLPGTLGEYNGKFMSGQMVLRGGCCATPEHHVRDSYRNFFPPDARWAFSGLRLARDLT
ncbi:ergothioneine biosynthesis protein EgtB [Larsenimonas rhizosphaerae]|uniref:Ergothioneine biosynthesis protein EgtB n=1 Tax=Larsenimonas rhizosphaerae TaxID=2944682 RepID=A0AA41ZLX4_9GAMM|nr:ergothioneine biosynthesis protein EgtB [Larsenimonas rhizosphaerae]MCX2524248.1 ergothioneine biosynthesis protein EgtB [Larsenimonas rhizosphaerae]